MPMGSGRFRSGASIVDSALLMMPARKLSYLKKPMTSRLKMTAMASIALRRAARLGESAWSGELADPPPR